MYSFKVICLIFIYRQVALKIGADHFMIEKYKYGNKMDLCRIYTSLTGLSFGIKNMKFDNTSKDPHVLNCLISRPVC